MLGSFGILIQKNTCALFNSVCGSAGTWDILNIITICKCCKQLIPGNKENGFRS
jgi:hypothetical protein